MLKLTLKEFIENFVEPNTLIRLQYKTKEGHEEVLTEPKMEWDLSKSKYATSKVVGVTDIWCDDNYREAVNVVIEK